MPARRKITLRQKEARVTEKKKTQPHKRWPKIQVTDGWRENTHGPRALSFERNEYRGYRVATMIKMQRPVRSPSSFASVFVNVARTHAEIVWPTRTHANMHTNIKLYALPLHDDVSNPNIITTCHRIWPNARGFFYFGYHVRCKGMRTHQPSETIFGPTAIISTTTHCRWSSVNMFPQRMRAKECAQREAR